MHTINCAAAEAQPGAVYVVLDRAAGPERTQDRVLVQDCTSWACTELKDSQLQGLSLFYLPEVDRLIKLAICPRNEG